MTTFFKKIGTFVKTHKKTSIAILIVILLVAYFVHKKLASGTSQTTYVLGTVQKGTIVSSITGSGQVASNRSLDLKPEASGNVVYIGVTAGQVVHQGDLIVELDDSDAQKTVRDAQANLTSAQISMQKLQEPADDLTLLQAQNALDQANSDLAKSYDDGFTAVSNAFLDLPSSITGVDQVLHNTDVSPSTVQANIAYYTDTATAYETTAQSGNAKVYSSDAETKFAAAKAAYDKNFIDYKNTDRTATKDQITSLINETYNTSLLVADAIKSAQNVIQYYQDVVTSTGRTPNPKSNTYLSDISSYTGKTNGDISSLLSAKNTITNDITTVPEKQDTLDNLKAGADPLDVQSEQLSLTRAQNALEDAKETLQNYYVRAPFDGTIAKVDVNKGDAASSGTAVATLIASGQVVDIPLNEVDVSKVAVGEKATLTFDAVEDLTLTGKVAAVDAVGTVTQGVVNYTVTIAFDSTDPRVKPGMSTTASIITEVHPDVLTVPSSAVKTNAGGSYVLAFTPALTDTGTGAAGVASETPPAQIPVTTGISDDTNTEIDSGLTEDQQIVVRSVTVTAASSATAASAPSLLGGSTGGAARAGGTAAIRGGGGGFAR